MYFERGSPESPKSSEAGEPTGVVPTLSSLAFTAFLTNPVVWGWVFSLIWSFHLLCILKLSRFYSVSILRFLPFWLRPCSVWVFIWHFGLIFEIRLFQLELASFRPIPFGTWDASLGVVPIQPFGPIPFWIGAVRLELCRAAFGLASGTRLFPYNWLVLACRLFALFTLSELFELFELLEIILHQRKPSKIWDPSYLNILRVPPLTGRLQPIFIWKPWFFFRHISN